MVLASWTPHAGGKGPPLVSSSTSLLEQEYHKGINLLMILLFSLHKQSNKHGTLLELRAAWASVASLGGRCVTNSTDKHV